MKIAVTGFLPFNGRDVNPAQLIVEQLKAPEGCTLVKKILSVEYDKSREELLDFLESEDPDILLSVGQAGNTPYIAVERVAINLDNTKTSDGKSLFPDQAGTTPVDEPIIKNGPNAYFSSLPVWDIVEAINKAGVPARASYSAGTFICNHVMYLGLDHASKNPGVVSGFIHVPFLPEQLEGNTTPGRYSMELSDMVTGVQTTIDLLSEREMAVYGH